MARSLVIGLSVSLLVASVGCGSAAPAATAAPTPASAAKDATAATPTATPTATATATTAASSSKNPKAKVVTTEKEDLERLATDPWGFKYDRPKMLRVPVVNFKNWRGFKVWGHPTRINFKYGASHRAIDTTLYTAIDGPNTPEKCMAKFMEYMSSTASAYGVHLGESQLVRMTQLVGDVAKPVLVRLLEGSIESIFANDDYVGAVAAYQSFPGTCLVHGFAVVATNHRELAIKVRDRWVSEGVQRLVWEKSVKTAPPIESH